MTDRKFSVVHVSTEKGWRGGEQQVKLVTDGLVSRGHQVRVLSPTGAALLADRQAAGIGVEMPLRFGEWDFAASRLIFQVARQLNADVIHAQTSHAHTLALRAARKLGIPLVVSRRVDFPVAMNLFSRRKYLDPAVRYIAISHAVKQVLLDGGVSRDKIQVVHSGVDPDRFVQRGVTRDEELARRWGAEPGVPLLVNAAALTDHKDQATLLRAAALLKQRGLKFRLVIAGSGELEEDLKRLQHELGLADFVSFPGYVTDLSLLYPGADLFVMSSHLEGLCTSILDAMSAGLPVVATRTGGIPEIIRDGQNGLLAQPRNPESLAAALQRILEEADLRSEFRAAGRHTVLNQFTNDAMVEGTIRAYGIFLGNSQPNLNLT
jgi:glycosyltransferase involved in cell wall biosynthesis